MKDFLNKAKAKADQLSRDFQPEIAGVKRTSDYLVDAGGKFAGEVVRLGKDVLKSDMAKEAAAGAAVGAVIAVPVPIIGPIAGAVIGGSLGFYKNITRPSSIVALPAIAAPVTQQLPVIDVVATEQPVRDKFEELDKLFDLKVKGVLTDEEFLAEKTKILNR